MVELKIKLDKGATMPFKANPTDSGYDLVATKISYNDEYGYLEYETGISLDIPEGYEVLLYPRSSLSKYELALCNSVGVVDESYKRPVLFRFRVTIPHDVAYLGMDGLLKCVSDTNAEVLNTFTPLMYKVGDKIGQMIMQKKLEYNLKLVDDIQDSGRGAFGSSDGLKDLVGYLNTIKPVLPPKNFA